MNRWLQVFAVGALLVVGWQYRGSHLSVGCSSLAGRLIPAQQSVGGVGASWRASPGIDAEDKPAEPTGSNPLQTFCRSLSQTP